VPNRILLVDDEPRVLDGLRRALRGRYEMDTAQSGAEGLAAVEVSVTEGAPFDVILSDMMMPAMTGAEFLTKARGMLPDAVLMILSGQADLTSTIAAVNDANLFRFLTKPCTAEELGRALDAALRQAQLIRSERELLQRTLTGAIEVLTEVMALASPPAARRTNRLRILIAAASAELGMDDDWRLPVAAMLSQIGCLAVPPAVLDQVETGGKLSLEERRAWLSHPEVGRRLLEHIPRLAEVAGWVGGQLDGAKEELGDGAGDARRTADLAAAMLPAAVAFLKEFDTGESPEDAAEWLAKARRHPRAVVKAMVAGGHQLTPRGVRREISAKQVRAGMLLEEDLVTTAGLVLLRRGERVSEVLVARLANFATSVGVVEPVCVLVGPEVVEDAGPARNGGTPKR
jgi:DNA-binding response OmpR family regulator